MTTELVYIVAMALYFYFTIVLSKEKKWLKRCIDWPTHVIAQVLALTFVLLAVFQDTVRTRASHCCILWHNNRDISRCVPHVGLFLEQYRKSQSYAFSQSLIQTSLSVLKEASVQSICCTIVYVNSMFWVALALWVPLATQGGDHSQIPSSQYGEACLSMLQLLSRLCCPMQGFLNFLVFARSGAKRWLKAHPDRNMLWALWQVIVQDAPPSDQALMRLASPPTEELSRPNLGNRVSSQFDTRSSSLFMSTRSIRNQDEGNGEGE